VYFQKFVFFEIWYFLNVINLYFQKILDVLGKERQNQILENIQELILATNMDHHAQILAKWRENSKYFTFDSEQHRLALMKYVLKFADISNPARPKVCKKINIFNQKNGN